MALLAVLIITMLIAGSSVSFIWFMNQQQTRAGRQYRAAEAGSAAEAGVYRAAAALETTAPDGSGPGRSWRPAAYTETLRTGGFERRFTISLSDDADGGIVVTSVGEAGGFTRRLRARVYLASPALLVALNGSSLIRLEDPPAATSILPYGAGLGDRPWVHMAAGGSIAFGTSNVSLNEPDLQLDVAPGPVDGPGAAAATRPGRPGPVRLLIPRDAALFMGRWGRERVEIQQLRVMGVYLEGVVVKAATFPPFPEVDQAFFQHQAAANTLNADLNRAAGREAADEALARKRDSLYTPSEFARVLDFLRLERTPQALRGTVYVSGGIILKNQRLRITDGTLVTPGAVQVGRGAELSIVHSPASRSLAGLLVLRDGDLSVVDGGRLRVHGLVYTANIFEVGKASYVDIVGSVLAADPQISFINYASTVVIRYDPAVLGTPGMRLPSEAPVIAWIASWEELP
jgi:hypothetical protein